VADGVCVHVIVRKSSNMSALSNCLDNISVHVHDGTTEGLLGIMNKARPTLVFHVAAVTSAMHEAEGIEPLIQSNVLFSTQLVEAMRLSGVRHLVNTETFWQHRDGSDAYDPVCLYAATKQAFRDILLYYVRAGDINAISLVLYDVYGPDDPRPKLFSHLRQAVRENRQLSMTPGEQIVDVTHVEDVVSAYLVAAEAVLSRSVGDLPSYSVTSGERMTLRELIELIARETGLPIAPVWAGKPYRPTEVMVPWLGEVLPGWEPRIRLAQGIREIFAAGGPHGH